ncbi:28S ribosomal protein S9, mitochondrial-like [Eriocheir sinensis]|uniref:28S ribosomal protein S9, mitochondrial-like n=1 Tax=Eriocheir sinensis TaxID=95602 RepID=UPI0021C6487D|nr:28S ribosomal protein S9, mitochondrial-like [Eriocheir sinensis]
MASLVSTFLRRSGSLLRSSCVAHPRAASGLQHTQPCSTNTAASASVGGSKAPEGENVVRVSKSMKAYQERAEAHDKFMVEQVAEYEIGRRHLANIMGEDPETFTQEDIDEAIAYLLPSGLFEPRARPAMKHPSEVFPKKKAAEFDISGRPFHHLFYTGIPSYYQALHDLGKTVMSLDQFSERMSQYKLNQDSAQAFNTGGSEWVSKEELEQIFVEKLQDKHYNFFIRAMTRLVEHPHSARAQDFIMRFRNKIVDSQKQEEIPKLMYTADGTPYMTGEGKRKWAEAHVTVYGRGSGKFDINGEDIRCYELIQDREQLVFPLQFTNLLGKVDVVAKVTGVGSSATSGAIRLATSVALQSFVDESMREKMRLAGLLTRDRRHRERKKPGQKGARAKYTWKKR